MIRRRLLVALPLLSLVAVAAVVVAGRAQSTPEELAEAKLFDRAVTAIERNYLDPARIHPHRMLAGALDQIQRTIPEILVRDGDAAVMTVQVGLAERRFSTAPMSGPQDLKRAMRDILSFIAANYHGETKPEDIEYAAIDGMLEVLDPHSNFMSPKVYKEFQVGTRGKFGGLGIVISIKDGQLTVIAPIEGTPASAAGIRAGDHILQIDDESTINMSLTDAVNKLRGDVGTKVTILVERPGKPPRRLTLTRAIINIDSVQHKLLAEDGKRIGYIKIKNFQQNTDEDVRSALASFREGAAKLDGLILDLRNNPGGLLNVAVDVADHFLKSGVIVTTVGARDQVLEKEVAHAAGLEEEGPVVVLLNEGSASASEIVAGALQANGRAVVMGRRSFGKGSVQTIFELGDDTALKLTIAQYKPAGTLDIQLAGLTPDVDLQPITVDRRAMNLIEDVLPSEGDLERHLEGSLHGGGGRLPRSPHAVRYLKPKEDEKEAEAKSVREYQKDPDIEKDFSVTIARRFLSRAQGVSRQAMLAEGEAVLISSGAEQQEAINGALKLLGIDWTRQRAGGDPKLKISYHLKSGKAEIARARAGQKIELEFTATNAGTGGYSRLIAVGQSELPLLSNLEFPFGALGAGQTRTWSVPIEIPEGISREDLLLDMTFEEGNGRLPEPLTAIIPIDALPQPAFAFSYRMTPEMKGRSLATGTPLTLAVEVANTGGGATSAETVATLSNDCGEKLFIESGRAKLGALPPKAARRAAFRFHLAGEGLNATCPLKLTIADIKRLLVLTKKLELDVKGGTIAPPPGPRYGPPVIDVGNVPTSTDEETLTLAGTISDTDPVRDYFVFVGDKKITYTPNAKDITSMPIAVEVPLEPGSNTIVIGARDAFDLMARRVLVVNRTSGERKKDKRWRSQSFLPEPNE